MSLKKTLQLASFSVLAGGLMESANAVETVWLDSLDLSSMGQEWGKPQADHSVTGAALSIGGRHFERGVGSHAKSIYRIALARGTEKFSAVVGVDDDANSAGSVVFQILADDQKVFDSGVMHARDAAKPVDLDLRNVSTLYLVINDAGDGIDNDHADWADARFIVSGSRPQPIPKPQEPFVILTPKPGPAPRINCANVYGCRPGHPFLYRIPTQGARPIQFSADGLPPGLQLDDTSGIITGLAPQGGEYVVTLRATNPQGTSRRRFKIVSGETLSLTPSMGWNDWYAHYDRITDQKMREAADLLVRTGMADVGYQYVNIDDCWMNAENNSDPKRVGPFRDAAGNLNPNTYFPDMKGLAEYIHHLGLKAGLYTSPGPKTCAGFAGAYQHEAQDARQFASWGFDFLKYDWCSYDSVASRPLTVEEMKRPYILMGNLLKEQNRDLLLNLCQYGMGEVWKWGAEAGGQSWRTSGDLGNELNHVFEVALKNCEHRDWQKPGAWNDPDYIQIGYLGSGQGFKPCPLSPNEQYAFMSLWCLMASPLFYSGDLRQVDEFTLNVLCNPEVIEIDQDPLGQCARMVRLTEDTFLMVKDLEDGSKAVGLGNRGVTPAEITVGWPETAIHGVQQVRDVWRMKDLGKFDQAFSTRVPSRAVVLVRLYPVK